MHKDKGDGVMRYGVYEESEMAHATQFGQRDIEGKVVIADPPLCNYASIRHKLGDLRPVKQGFHAEHLGRFFKDHPLTHTGW